VDRAPLSMEEMAQLRETTSRLGFSILFSPDAPPVTNTLRDIVNAPDNAALEALSAQWHIDVTAPTDDRPFFFNQLRIFDPASIMLASQAPSGAFNGNLWATIVLAIIVVLSFSFVILTILIPAFPSLQQISTGLSILGTSYFLFIGLGFMLVEVGLVQRLSLFLGHPVYGLAIGLFAVILSTGVGSLMSDQLSLRTTFGVPLWSWFAVLLVAALPWFLSVLSRFDDYSILGRIGIVVLLVSPVGIPLGFAFPTGMQLVNRVDTRPTPWFWAINGAASVLGTSLAVAVNNAWSISASLRIGAICYLLAGLSAALLMSGAHRMKLQPK
jgi:hypothetical protein